MKKLLTLFVVLAASLCAAQTPVTVTIPAPDGKTITSANNVWSCVSSGAVVYNSTTGGLSINGVTVGLLSLKEISLTGGTTYSAGTYLASISATGQLTYIPYTPSDSTAAGTTYTVAQPAQAGWAVVNYPVTGLTLAKGQTMAVWPAVANPASLNGINWHLIAGTSGQVWVTVINGNGTTLPAANWTVVVK
jgi:hypothetical protein